MIRVNGKSVYRGIAVGPVVVLKNEDCQVKRRKVEDPEAEIERVNVAVKQAQEQLSCLYKKAVKEVGESNAAIFEVHQMLLEDEDYLDALYNMIRTEGVNAEYAAAATGDNFSEMFAGMDDDYMKARAADKIEKCLSIRSYLYRIVVAHEQITLFLYPTYFSLFHQVFSLIYRSLQKSVSERKRICSFFVKPKCYLLFHVGRSPPINLEFLKISDWRKQHGG